MKTKILLISFYTSLLTGCGSSYTPLVGSSLAAAGGERLGRKVDKDWGGLAGAAGGVALFQGAMIYKSRAERAAFEAGRIQGSADAVFAHEKALKEFHRDGTAGPQKVPVFLPPRTINGINYAPTTSTINLHPE